MDNHRTHHTVDLMMDRDRWGAADHRYHGVQRTNCIYLAAATVLLLVLAGACITTPVWLVTGLAAGIAGYAGRDAWRSRRMARAVAAACPVCHPPCEPDPTTG